jgi:hypothetical protein
VGAVRLCHAFHHLTPDEYATLTIDLNRRREQLLWAYDQLDCPVELVLATKSAGEQGSALSETMPCGDLEENTWGACIQRFLSSGWTAPINSHLRSRSALRAPLTRLSNAFRLACQSQRETSDHHQLPRTGNTAKGKEMNEAHASAA